MATIQLDRVSKIYPGDVRAVNQISLDIQDGEFVVLVGPSGCGKSTTLRMVAGLESISEGQVRIGGDVVNNTPPKDRDIAMVFQNYALYPHMTVYKNMAFGLKLRKFSKAEIDRRIQRASEILQLEPLLKRKPKAMSGGQRQRVALGRAIVREPKCFLFDEPLSNLDAKLRMHTRAEIKQLHQRLQTTTIYVTHDQEEAMTLGDKVVVMANGVIQQAADPLTVFHQPANQFVAAFVGIPTINLIDGQLQQSGSGVSFNADGLSILLPDSLTQALGSEQLQQPVTLGIRPESLMLRPQEGHRHTERVQAQVQVIEPLGSQMDLSCDTSSGHQLVARTTSEPLKPGDNVDFYLNPEGVHLFAQGEYGQNLALPQQAASAEQTLSPSNPATTPEMSASS